MCIYIYIYIVCVCCFCFVCTSAAAASPLRPDEEERVMARTSAPWEALLALQMLTTNKDSHRNDNY